MSNDLHEKENVTMPSQSDNWENTECEPSLPYRKISREEGREMIREAEAFGARLMAYMKEHDMLLKPCPAPKIK